jgi:hypothetical protein
MWAVRDPGPTLRLALVLGVIALVVFVAPSCWARAATAPPAGCSSFGPSFLRSYNREAARQGNPVRIVSACCKPTAHAGVNACHIMVTLVGTADRGCESVEISNAGSVVSQGKHESCPVKA